MVEREVDIRAYLASCGCESNAAIALLEQIQLQVPIRCPNVSVGPSREVFLTWERGTQYFEIQMSEGAPTEVFYHDRGNSLAWDEDLPAEPDFIEFDRRICSVWK